jgi:hypothetical protein
MQYRASLFTKKIADAAYPILVMQYSRMGYLLETI